jgi:alkanesulfonate monooxygenase SsuD/methylene tetrahydromethanopterin reductase-like flavin-dependent oxidoreductase (luciferase family)
MLPQMGPLAHYPCDVARFAHQAEELGADSLLAGDRLLAPVKLTVGYGGGRTIPGLSCGSLTRCLLAIAATYTKRIQIGTNVLNASWYPPPGHDWPVALAASANSSTALPA